MTSWDDYVAASTIFGQQIMDLTDDEWFFSTPCSEWDVRTIVAHVILGEAMLVDLLKGGVIEPLTDIDVSILGPNPIATWRGTAVAAIDAASEKEVETKKYEHPLGNIDGTTIIGLRVTENLVHASDIAQACGRQIELPEELADRCLDFWAPLTDALSASDMIGDPVMPPEDASPGTRLLCLMGREINSLHD